MGDCKGTVYIVDGKPFCVGEKNISKRQQTKSKKTRKGKKRKGKDKGNTKKKRM
jgi:hypothetical protein